MEMVNRPSALFSTLFFVFFFYFFLTAAVGGHVLEHGGRQWWEKVGVGGDAEAAVRAEDAGCCQRGRQCRLLAETLLLPPEPTVSPLQEWEGGRKERKK